MKYKKEKITMSEKKKRRRIGNIVVIGLTRQVPIFLVVFLYIAGFQVWKSCNYFYFSNEIWMTKRHANPLYSYFLHRAVGRLLARWQDKSWKKKGKKHKYCAKRFMVFGWSRRTHAHLFISIVHVEAKNGDRIKKCLK